MRIRGTLLGTMAALALAGGCRERTSGPVQVSVIGGAPELANANLSPLSPPAAVYAEAVAQGLVRFDAAGQIEPALAQSWIVSDDGLRYTFRLARTEWPDGRRVTAEQVEARLRATLSRSSRNPLKPLLGAITDVEAMTESVLEIALLAPRPNLLQLLAQPEMAIILNGQGTGPFRAEAAGQGAKLLQWPREDGEEAPPPEQSVVLRGERAALAVARFRQRAADLVTGGTAGDLPIVRVARVPGAALRFDPAAGLFGLHVARTTGRLANPAFRAALSMAVDRPALVAALGVPDHQPRETIVPSGIDELPVPAFPAWAGRSLTREAGPRGSNGCDRERRATRADPRRRPDQPGYRVVFAHLKRDWRMIGVAAEAVAPGAAADLVLVDSVAPANLPPGTCAASPARPAPSAARRPTRCWKPQGRLSSQASGRRCWRTPIARSPISRPSSR
jgi:peptide/nickel transport system substrate-binding protein